MPDVLPVPADNPHRPDIAGPGNVIAASFTLGAVSNFLRQDGTWALPPGGGGGSVWGGITGTLSNQTDLQTALNLKANTSAIATVGFTGVYNDLSGKPTLGTLAAISFPGGTSTFFRADGTFASVPSGGVAWGAITGTLSDQTDLQTALNLKATLASPTFTGTPAAPTAAADTNTTQLATTAFVVGQASSATPANDGTASSGSSLRYSRGDHVHNTDSTRAPLASPTFTGVPAAPTATVDTNTTQLATTAFVLAQAASATPAALGTAAVGTSLRYARGDHVHSSVVTTAGDILYSSSGVTLARLAIGTAGQVLSVAAGLPSWAAGMTNPLTTTGDILVSVGGTTPGRLGIGANGQFLGVTGGALTWSSPSGSGDVVGPASATTGRIAVYNGATGKLLQDGTKLEADVVTGPASVVTARIATFNGTTGKIVQDGGVTVADLQATDALKIAGPGTVVSGRTVVFSGTTGLVVVQASRLEADLVAGPATSTSLRVAVWNGTGGKTLQDGTKLESDLVIGPATSTSGRIAVFNGTGGKTLQDGTKLEADVVTGPASVTTARIATFNGTTGKIIQDSGTLVADLAPLASPTFTGTPAAPTAAVGTNTTQLATTAFVIANKVIEQNSQSTAYTAVLADANKHLLHPSADTTARTFTIPANASVAYIVGTALTFVNQNAAGVMTIAITTDTMRLAGAGTTGSRTLAANGIATALKITSTEWIINGTGLT